MSNDEGCQSWWRRLDAYFWGEGVYLAAGTEKGKAARVCILVAREAVGKELLAMESATGRTPRAEQTC